MAYTGTTLKEKLLDEAREIIAAPKWGDWLPGDKKPKPRPLNEGTAKLLAEVMFEILEGRIDDYDDLNSLGFKARRVAEEHGLSIAKTE